MDADNVFVRTSRLDIEVRDFGPRAGPVALLLHGWPDDASTWSGIEPALNAAGFRTLAPMLRGFGGTRFRHRSTPRTGNAAMLAYDAMRMLEALGIERCMVAGHDWGSNIAEAMAINWPTRIPRLAMLSTPSRIGGLKPPSLAQAQRQWYHWFQTTGLGAKVVASDPKSFAHIMWQNWSPPGWFDIATFERVAKSFDNPDWVAVTLHSYRARWDEARPDPRSARLEAKIKHTRSIPTPTIYFQGEADGVNPPGQSVEMASKFSGDFRRIVLPDVGHFPTREAPVVVGNAIADFFSRG